MFLLIKACCNYQTFTKDTIRVTKKPVIFEKLGICHRLTQFGIQKKNPEFVLKS